MKASTAILAVSAGLALLAAGCSRNETKASVTELEKAFQLKNAAAAPAPAQNAAAVPGPGDQVQQTVSHAVSAMKTNGYTEAFVALRSIQAAPGLTLDQYTAIANARLAVEKQLAEKAVAGDPAAMRAVESIKKMAR